MAGIVEALSAVGSVLKIIEFSMQDFPEEQAVESVVRISVGLDSDGGLNDAGGDLPDVRIFNENGEFLGLSADPGTVTDGTNGDISVSHNDDNGQQGTYTLFSANDNAICIAYASITFPSSDRYSWVGDWGRECGGDWYFSNVYIQGTSERPDCLWIDGNNDTAQTGFQVHWPEFYIQEGDGLNTTDESDQIDYFCKSGPPFKLYNYVDVIDPTSITFWQSSNNKEEDVESKETAISYGPPKPKTSARSRRSQSRYPRQDSTGSGNKPHGNRLIIGDAARHSAQSLCESETSKGPDFVNIVDGKFCRMTDKTLWSVCDGAENVDNCFNTDTQQLIINGVSARDAPYAKVLDWTSSD